MVWSKKHQDRFRISSHEGRNRNRRVDIWIAENGKYGFEAGITGESYIGFGASPATAVKSLMKDARKNRGKDTREF